MDRLLQAQSGETAGPLLAYVGTFSSPLRDVLPTQVDLPPGNGRGIHLFQVNCATGAMTPAGIHEMGTSPSCLALNTSGTRLYSANGVLSADLKNPKTRAVARWPRRRSRDRADVVRWREGTWR